MIPGTTPTFILRLKNAEDYLKNTVSLKVDIKQGNVLITKEQNELVIDTEQNSVGVTLTQKESNQIQYKNGNIEFQIHGLLNDNKTSWKTYVVSVTPDRALTRRILKNEE